MNKNRCGWSYPTLQERLDDARAIFDAQLETQRAKMSSSAFYAAQMLGRSLAYVCGAISYMILASQAAILDFLFLPWATGIVLDLYGSMMQLPRQGKSRAKGTWQAVATAAATIPAGYQVISDAGRTYYVDSDTSTSAAGPFSVPITASEWGSASNLERGARLTLVNPVAYISRDSEDSIAESDISGGSEIESDDDYRPRLLYRAQHPPCGGSEGDYVSWAEESEIVDTAWCLPCTPSPGYVTVLTTLSAAALPEATADSLTPVPHDDDYVSTAGAAYRLALRARTAHTFDVSVAAFASALGHEPDLSLYVGGRVRFDQWSSADKSELTISGITLLPPGTAENPSAEERYRITTTSSLTSLPQSYEAIDVLCYYTATIYDAIRYDSDGSRRTPAEATLRVQLPRIQTVSITYTITPESAREAADAELSALLAEYGPGNQTCENWRLHDAIASATGHASHAISDVDGGGPAADVVLADQCIGVLEA